MTRAFQRALGVPPGLLPADVRQNSGSDAEAVAQPVPQLNGARQVRATARGCTRAAEPSPPSRGSNTAAVVPDPDAEAQRWCSGSTSMSTLLGPETTPLVVTTRRVMTWWPGGSGLKRMK